MTSPGRWGGRCKFTNILRDLAEDAARERVYLPGGWLRDAGIPTHSATAIISNAALPQVCERMAKQAHRYFASAEAAMNDCKPRAMRPARVMSASYKAVLQRLESRGWTRLNEPVSVPKVLKLWFILRYGIL